MKIEEIDRNFIQKNESDGMSYLDCRKLPFAEITGLPWLAENGNFHRLPDRLAEQYSEGVRYLSHHTSGAALRFRTDAEKIGFRVVLEDAARMAHMAFNGIMGLDVFSGLGSDSRFEGAVFAPIEGDSYSGTVCILRKGMKDITVNFPLYSGVRSLEIGFPEGTETEAPTKLPYLPVCFYGSSITQGGCASRPGNNYCSIVGRRLGFSPFNLGFSGNGKGEQLIAELIGSVPLSAFVLDYDHNAPSEEHLKATHYDFYRTVRNAQPKIPILMMSKTDTDRFPGACYYRDIIADSYGKAVAEGDKNVYFIDGSRIYGTDGRDCCTVDGCHPNDLGFYRIAVAVERVLGPALKCIR